MNILIFILILLVLVVVHEFGHFFAAKKFGIRVDEFGFGFPPKIFGKKYGETEYTLNALPFGGFVKIFGENPDDENTNGPDAGRSFVNKAKYKQAIVLVAGVVSNFLLAWLLFSFTFMSGLPTSLGSEVKGNTLQDLHVVITSLVPKSPAETAGLKLGDKIVSITSGKNSTTYISPETVKSFVVGSNGQKIEIGYLRGSGSTENTIEVTPQKSSSGEYVIGIAMDQIGIEKLGFFQSFVEGMKLTIDVGKSTIVGLYTLIAGAFKGTGSLSSVTGPVGMVGIVGDAYKLGFSYLVSFVALISVNLAVINLLPFPALDGGRLLFLLIEKIKGTRINPKIANNINLAGFAILVIFMLLVTYHDVVKLL